MRHFYHLKFGATKVMQFDPSILGPTRTVNASFLREALFTFGTPQAKLAKSVRSSVVPDYNHFLRVTITLRTLSLLSSKTSTRFGATAKKIVVNSH